MQQRVVLVVDLGFGDAGKGTMVDFLTRREAAHTVVRFNGGPQAAHNVVTVDGRHHTFAQIGSGGFVEGVSTFLSRYMLVEPYALFNEAEHLASVGVAHALARVMIDRRAPVITPYHRALNQLRELARGEARHGSCGLGVGEAMADWLRDPASMIVAGELPDTTTVRQKLTRMREAKRAEAAALSAAGPQAEAAWATFEQDDLADAVAENYAYVAGLVALVDEAGLDRVLNGAGTVVFEGAQGVLLDADYGFAPYTTWSRTTFANAVTLLDECGYGGDVYRLGVLRTYSVRHGAGPFVAEDPALAAALPEAHNGFSAWQRAFRVGWFDAVAMRYGLAAAGSVDGLALTHVDRVAALDAWQICEAYRYTGPSTAVDAFFERDGELVTQICLPDVPDWERQAELARRLFSCKPVYRAAEKNDAVYMDLVAQTVGVPVVVTSHGPTANDKQVRGRTFARG